MNNYPYILFNKAPLQLRLIGARGGRAFGRNQRIRRARLALLPTPPQATPLCAVPGQTAAQAIALLDAQFPWLRRAEERLSRKRQNPR
jgi:FAD/FMN-containing dehydrogenase